MAHTSSADTCPLCILFLLPGHSVGSLCSYLLLLPSSWLVQEKDTERLYKKPHSQNRLNPYVYSPFHQTASWQKFTSLFTGMLFLAAGILGTSQQLDFVQNYIHMISLYSHIWTFSGWMCCRMLSLMVISYWPTFQKTNRFVSYSFCCSQIFCLALKKICFAVWWFLSRTLDFLYFMSLVKQSSSVASFWVFINNKSHLR